MAQRIILVDDLDPEIEVIRADTFVETVAFSLDGNTYEIDLGESHREDLHEALKPFIDKARLIGGAKKKSGKSSKASRQDLSEIRAWGQAHGWEVRERGRVPKELIAAYDARNSHAA